MGSLHNMFYILQTCIIIYIQCIIQQNSPNITYIIIYNPKKFYKSIGPQGHSHMNQSPNITLEVAHGEAHRMG
jgi:hypothetical protein